jgi:hypothetical protein
MAHRIPTEEFFVRLYPAANTERARNLPLRDFNSSKFRASSQPTTSCHAKKKHEVLRISRKGNVKIKVRVTLRLAVYRQSVRIGAFSLHIDTTRTK